MGYVIYLKYLSQYSNSTAPVNSLSDKLRDQCVYLVSMYF